MTLTKVQIIQETADFYAADPKGRRAPDHHSACFYLTNDGRKCAVGRCLLAPQKEWYGTVSQRFESNNSLDDALIPQYRGHNLAFWSDVQIFHDRDRMWTDTGLSNRGRVSLAELLAKYADVPAQPGAST